MTEEIQGVLTKEMKIKHFYEYALWNVVDSYNLNVVNENKKGENKSIITCSEARALRDAFEQRLKDAGRDISTLGKGSFSKLTDEIYGERIGYKYYGDNYDAIIKQQTSEFLEMSGIGSDRDRDQIYLPISPYDPEFSDRKSIRENGSRLSGVSITQLHDMYLFAPGLSIGLYTFTNSPQGGRWWMSENKPTLTSKEDILGITPLMKYMSEKEFEECSAFLLKSMKEEDFGKNATKLKKELVDKAIYILEGLNDMGQTYTIEPDINDGQLIAKLEGSNFNVRILDRAGQESYIGRVYDNGVYYHYSTTRKENGKHVEYIPTKEEALDLVKFVLGENLNQWDDPDKVIGQAGVTSRRVGGNLKEQNEVYHTSGSFVVRVGSYGDTFGNDVVITADTKKRSATTTYFGNSDDALMYLNSSIDSARRNLEDLINVKYILDEFNKHGEEEDYYPDFKGDDLVVNIQQGYWDLLTGRADTLFIPSTKALEFQKELNDGEFDLTKPEDVALYNSKLREIYYDSDMNKYEMIKQHLEDTLNYEIGNFNLDSDGKRFNPVGVSTYQTSELSLHRRNDDIVEVLKILNIDSSELKGDAFYNNTIKDKLIKFDDTNAVSMKNHESEFIQRMYNDVYDSLINNGAVINDPENDILIDDNGIIMYNARIYTKQGVTLDDHRDIRGTIGQIFIPDELGIIETKFAGSDNYASIPGYEAYIRPQKFGENKSVEERTKLKSYEQILKDNIRYQIRQDLLKPKSDSMALYGTTTSINKTYRQLYEERYALDFKETYREMGMPESDLLDIIETQKARVRYSNAIKEGSTVNADFRARSYQFDVANDNFNNPYVLTGGRNMALLTPEGDGYFDPVATSATSTNQGVLRYLTTETQVDHNGYMIPGSKNARAAIMNNDIMKYSSYDPVDRQCMTVSNYLHASNTTRPVNLAQMTFGGWNFDDAIVVSKQFAEEYPIKNAEGQMRPLTIGDKLSDAHGNKGVISLVVDAEMDLDEAKSLGIEDQVKWFKANPTMDMVMAPFPAVSRFNGGTAREMMQNPSDLINPDTNEVIPGGLGGIRMIITDKSVDSKTNIYDTSTLAEGRGRKVSSQLAWALNSQDTPNIMKSVYSANSSPIVDLREILNLNGLDIDATGNLLENYQPQHDEDRKVINMPDLIYNAKGEQLNNSKLNKAFADEISSSGGILELPFELKYSSSKPIPPLNDNKDGFVLDNEGYLKNGYVLKGDKYVRTENIEGTTWGLPILSSHLRSGQDFVDGTSSVHDYTRHYLTIFTQANKYRNAVEQLSKPDLSSKDKKRYETAIITSQRDAQGAFDSMVNDINNRQLKGKHNIFRDGLMSRKMAKSATAIWSPDPRLNIDEIAISPAIAQSMGVKDGYHILVWRDPMLRDSGLRYMKCKIDPNLIGVAINPAMDKCFDGDFDGDSVGLLNIIDKDARMEAMKKLSVASNLLDVGSKDENGLYGLNIQDSLDIKVAIHNNPELGAELKSIVDDINVTYSSGAEQVYDITKEHVKDLNKFYKKAFKSTVGDGIIRNDTMENHLQSVYDACITTGAKGSPAKYQDYMKYLGVEAKLDDNGIVKGSIKDNETTLAAREDNIGVFTATAVKTFGTGVAGTFSQRGIAALRNKSAKAVLELTYPVTQSILQVKHNPEEALHKYDILMGPARDLWRGYEMEKTNKGWKARRNHDGTPIQADVETWKKQFIEIYTSSDGLNVNINDDFVNDVASYLDNGRGVMLNIESDEIEGKAFMDKMAYEPTMETLRDGAKANTAIFEGLFNSQFMPSIVSKNIEGEILSMVAENIESQIESFDKSGTIFEKNTDIKPILKKDVVKDYKQNKKTSGVATVRREPATIESNNDATNDKSYH